MEFTFDVRGVVPDAITRVSRDQLPGGGGGGLSESSKRRDERSQQLAAIINKLGAASAKAQGLRAAVTTFQKLMASSHTLYLLRDDDGELPAVLGILKVGRKKLFLRDPQGVQRETEPLCVLDFYIHESWQRAGLGRRLFQAMLQMEGVRVSELAIDRPSSKFLSFLRKHYSLHSDVRQGNNFVVFSQFFQNSSSTSSRTTAELTDRLSGSSAKETGQERVAREPQPIPEEAPTATTPKKTRHNQLALDHPTPDNNHNWSPDSVLLCSRQRLRPPPCDIITGVPLPAREKPVGGGAQETVAPLLTLRDRERCLKGGSRLGFGGPFARLSSMVATPQGYHPMGGAHFGRSRDSTYSRHNLNSKNPSFHTLKCPDQKI